jgi:hypothetical protein
MVMVQTKVVFENTGMFLLCAIIATLTRLSTLATDAAGQLDVLGHNGNTFGVDGAQVGVLEQTHQVGLRRLLQGQHSGALEAQVGLEVLGDLAHQTLEGQLADQELGGFLVLADLAQSHGTRTVTMGLLHAASGRRRLTRSLGRELLAGCLTSGGFACGLLGTSHGEFSGCGGVSGEKSRSIVWS